MENDFFYCINNDIVLTSYPDLDKNITLELNELYFLDFNFFGTDITTFIDIYTDKHEYIGYWTRLCKNYPNDMKNLNKYFMTLSEWRDWKLESLGIL